MMRIVWITDPHLNFTLPAVADAFFENVRRAAPDMVLVGGDIGESDSVIDWLSRFDDEVSAPISFVLGNHDFYNGSIIDVRRRVSELCRTRPSLNYLSEAQVTELTTSTCLVGHDGWADCRIGDYERSYVMLNDYRLIAELKPYNKRDRWPHLMELGDRAAEHLRKVLSQAVKQFSRIFLVTHVPPWREACWYEGRLSDDEWAPHFTCKAVGDAITDVMRIWPERQLTVLCGHTHGEGQAQILPNVRVLTGGAEYGHPNITRILEIE